MVQALLFDFDGTLIDLEERWIIPLFEAVREIKRDIDLESIEQNLGIILEKTGGNTNFLVVKAIWAISRIAGLNTFQSMRLLLKLMRRKNQFRKIVPLESAERVLGQLRNEFDMALVTSASSKTVEAAISQYNFFGIFDAVVTRDDVENAKPDPEPVLLACKKLGVDPSQAVMIGDLPGDVEAGKMAGTSTIAILGKLGQYTRDYLEKSQPDLLLDSLEDLPQALKELTIATSPSNQ